MVDEQYHTLMHLNASAVIRRRRGWHMPESVLPPCRTVREHRAAVAAAPDPRGQALIRLAFTTVAETSISAFLALMTEDAELQPVNRTTVALHRRDELSHASLAAELLKMVFTELGPGDRAQLLAALAAGIEAFTGSDLGTWAAIVDAERVPGGRAMLADVAATPPAAGGAGLQRDPPVVHRTGRRGRAARHLVERSNPNERHDRSSGVRFVTRRRSSNVRAGVRPGSLRW